MDTTPVWLASSGPNFPTLDQNLTVDVLVIGGGITGLTAAYLLKQAGKRVALLEKQEIGGGDTGHTTAHLTCVTDLRLSKLVESFGKDHAQAAWDAGQFAIEEIFSIARREGIECQLQRVPGYLFAARSADVSEETERLHREAHLAMELGFDVDFLERVPVMDQPGIGFANQGEFHPLQYLRGLAQRIESDGDRIIFEHSEVTEFDGENKVVKVGEHQVHYEHCVIATHVPLQANSSTWSGMWRQTKLASYSSYAVGGKVRRGHYPKALFWDTSDPYLYIRFHQEAEQDYAIIGGADHKTGQADEEAAYEKIRQRALAYFPDLQLDHRWSGQVIETADGLPYIGPTESGEFIATGFSGNGMTFGTLAGAMARDWVLGKTNPWSDLFAVERKKLSAAWDYLRKNKDYPYYMAKALLNPPEEAHLEDIGRGDGRVVRLHGEKCAVHRDQDGNLSICSAVCPHMGCIVEWNAAEKSWDCPCHGSRFKATGEVFAGPAETALEDRSAVSA